MVGGIATIPFVLLNIIFNSHIANVWVFPEKNKKIFAKKSLNQRFFANIALFIYVNSPPPDKQFRGDVDP